MGLVFSHSFRVNCIVQAEKIRIYFSKHFGLHFAVKLISSCGILMGAWKFAKLNDLFVAARLQFPKVFALKLLPIVMGTIGMVFLSKSVFWKPPFTKGDPISFCYAKKRLLGASRAGVDAAIEIFGGRDAFGNKIRDSILKKPLRTSVETYFQIFECLQSMNVSLNSTLFPGLANGEIKKRLLQALAESLKADVTYSIIEVGTIAWAMVTTYPQRVDHLMNDFVITGEQAQKLHQMISIYETRSPSEKREAEFVRLRDELVEELNLAATKIVL